MAQDFKFGFTIEAVTKGFEKINKDLEGFNKKAKDLSVGFTKLGTKLTLGLTAPIAIFAATSIKAFKEQEKNLTKFADSFEKQGARIGISFDELKRDAEDFSKNSLFESDDILGGVTSQLLAFTNINRDVFKDAEQVIIDFAAKTGGDLQSATLAIGKALQNPTEGLNLLRRQGVAITDSQVDLVAQLDKTGRSAEAQAEILKILRDQYGGFAAEIANTDTGKLDQLAKSFKELQQNFGQAFLKLFRPFIIFLTDVIRHLDQLSLPSKIFLAFFATLVAAIGPALIALGQLRIALVALEIPLIALAAPAGLIALATATLIGLFEVLTHMDEIFLKVNEGFLKMFPTNEQLLKRNKEIRDSIERAKKDAEEALKGPPIQGPPTAEQAFIGPPVATPKQLSPVDKQKIKDRVKEIKDFTKQLLDEADAELAAERAANAPKFLDGLAFNQLDPNQVALKLNPDLSELKTKVDELSQSEQILSDSFGTFFEDISFGAKSASEAFKDLGRSIVNSLFSSALRSALNAGFAGLFPTKADGGPIGTFAEGGSIRGPGTGTSDSILARVSNGEFVMKADSVKKFGLNFMNMLNKGMMPAFAGGGFMSNFGNYLGSVPRFATGGPINSQKPSVNVNVLNNSSQPVTAKSSQSVDVRGTVINIILEDLKTNGPISQGNQQAFGLRR